MEAPPKLDRLERVTDLVLVLLDTEQPLTLDAIAHQVPGYPSEHSARRQAFERDKRLLRDEGIPVLTQRLPGHEQYGYLIDRESFYLPDLDLEPDEQVALHLAVAGVHLGDPSGRDALLKLGATGLGDVRPIASLVPSAALVELFEAVRTHATSTFSYRGGPPRVVAPVGLWFRFGHWYLVAWDVERAGVRTFRVDRIEGAVTRGDTGSAHVPDDIDVDVKAAVPDEPWEAEGENAVDMRIRVDALEARRVVDEVGEDKVVQRADDGSVDLVLGVSGFPAIRSWVLGLLDHATIIEPTSFRDELVAWLDGLTESASGLPAESVVAAVTEVGGTGGGQPQERARRGDEPAAAAVARRRGVAGPGRGGADGGGGAAVRHEREGARGRAGVGGVLRDAAVYAGHAHGDRGLGAFRAGVPAGGVRPAAAADAGRGVRRGSVGPAAARGARFGGRRAAAGLGQAGRRAGIPGSGGPRRGRAGASRRGPGSRRRGPPGGDRLRVGVAGRADHPGRGTGAGGDDRRALVSRRLLPPGG